MSSAPAKIILFGEHAVVYGQPAIAVPVSALRAYANVIESGTNFQIIARDLEDRIIQFEVDDPLAEVVRRTLRRIGHEAPNVTITVRSDIPIASGLGSGAAISTAIVRALIEYLQAPLTLEEINEIVYEVETIHHGTPSGIDNTVVVYEQSVYFVRDMPIETIEICRGFDVVVADTGQAALTLHSVADVRKLYTEQPQSTIPVIEAIGQVSRDARDAMQNGQIQMLGTLMTKNHDLLRKLTVSSEQLDRLVSCALDAGALGAKLSGGGRGGNMIALVDDESAELVMDALRAAGAVRVFKTRVEGRGHGDTT